MAALTDAMKWYSVGGLKAARQKYLFKVEFYSSQYIAQLGGESQPARLIFDAIRTIELPKYSIETEVVNSWNVRQVVPTRINFEPISISFNDTIDNRFQRFIEAYMNIVSNNFRPLDKSYRSGFDGFGLKSLNNDADCPIDKIVIYRFYGADPDAIILENQSVCTLWRPKIIDIQHDTLDYNSSDAVTWQIGVRYESVTYYAEKEKNPGPQPDDTNRPTSNVPEDTTTSNRSLVNLPDTGTRQWNWPTGTLQNGSGSDLPPSA